MAIIHINKETLVKKWKEFYGEDFSKEYKGLSDSISDEVIIEKEGVIIFRGTQEELTQFVIDAQEIANYFLLDVTHDNISEDETPNLDVDTYRNFGLKYGEEIDFDEIEEGGSIEHEIDLAIDSIDQLLEEEEDYEDLGGTGHGDISWSDTDQGL